MRRRHRPGLHDPALVFFLDYLRRLPPEQRRRGLNEWCRENGIITPEMQRAIDRWEIDFSDLKREPDTGRD